jgi:outer membrane protein assembly factor BamE (lipoprotein component of BamABCDE complex)
MRGLPLLVLLVSVGCSACSSFSDGPYQVTDGRFFDTRLLADIEDGQTTAAQILEWFGEPIEKRSTDAGETWRFHVVRQRKSVEDPVLGNRIVHLQEIEQSLVIELADGRVVAHRYETGTEESIIPPG